jgi:cytochrome P450
MKVDGSVGVGPEALVGELLTPPFASDPYGVVGRLRDVAPMFRSELGFWCASSYAACEDVFRSPDVGLGFNAARLAQDERFATRDSLQLFGRMLPFVDPPDHTRIRRILGTYFTPRSIALMRPYTQGLVDRLLDGIAAQGGGDLVGDYAENIPIAVMCQLLGGIGEEDQAQCRNWAEGLVAAVHPLCDEAMMATADAAARAFCDYFEGLLHTGGEGDSLVTRLRAEEVAGNLDHAEMLANATTLVGAAYHNTRNHIATGIYTLLCHPDQLDTLRRDPGLTPQAVEELLRYEPPVQVTLPRVAQRDTTVGGMRVQEGEHVTGLVNGANRDPARYRDPDRFDITRDDGGSLALAHGIHNCIGSAMARMEGEVAIRSFFERFDRVRLVDEEPDVDLPGLPLTRGFRRIRVEVGSPR